MDEVLHALRLKGLASIESVAAAAGIGAGEAGARLEVLAAGGLALERSGRRTGWVLTAAGRERNAAEAGAALDADSARRVEEAYTRFLALNGSVKGLCARWQFAGEEARFDLVEELSGHHPKVEAALTETGIDRFGRHAERLTRALEQIDDDPRYFASPLVESYHTVWFEAHEDFIVSLGRDRATEGAA